MIGGVASNTVTVNEQLEDPTALIAVAVIVVVPTTKKLPGAMEYVMVDAGIAVVSVAAKFTLAPHWPAALLTVIFEGQSITGANPETVTVKEHVAVNPPPSVTI